MLELYDVFQAALGGQVPLDNTKYEKDYCQDCLVQIQKYLSQHEGEMAVLIKVDGKKILPPKLVQIYKVCGDRVILRYKIYDNYGNFRGYLNEFTGCSSIYCKQVQIKIFGNI